MNTVEKQPEPPRQSDNVDAWLNAPRFAAIIGLLIFATFPGVLLGKTTFVVRDYGMFSFPVAYFHQQCFWRGEWPLWDPLSQCGVPFLAQWNTMALYPLSLIYLLFPLTWSLSFFCLAHLFWGGLGMYFLARRWTGSQLGAALAGVIYSFNGLSLNFLMWPSHEATFSWVPWVLWLVQDAWRQGGRRLFWAVLAGGMQMLAGGPETIFLTWLFLAALAGLDWLRAGRQARLDAASCQPPAGTDGARAVPAHSSFPRGPASETLLAADVPDMLQAGTARAPQERAGRSLDAKRSQICLRFLSIMFLVALVCSAQLLPFLRLLAHSQRDTGFGSWGWAMPIWGWANFLVPLFRTAPTPQGLYLQIDQYWTGSYYAGIGTVFLAAVALRRIRDPRLLLLGCAVALAMVFALGDRGLLYRAVRFCLPAIGFVRYPVKYVILILALAPLLAAFGLRALAGETGRAAFHRVPEPPQAGDAVERVPAGPLLHRFEWLCAAGIAGLIGLIFLLDRLFPHRDAVWSVTWKNGLSRAALLGVIVYLITALVKSSGPKRTLSACLLLVAFWFDFATHVPFLNPGAARWVYSPGWAAKQLDWKPAPQLGRFRAMMSPGSLEAFQQHVLPSLEQTYLLDRLAMMGNCNLLDGAPFAYGFFSLMPLEANNVNAMPFVYTNSTFTGLLDLMAVAQTSSPENPMHWSPRPSATPMVTAGQQPVFADDNAVVNAFFANTNDFRKIVYLPPEARGVVSATAQPAAQVLTNSFENQQVFVQIQAPAPSILLVSQSWYPAWKAYVDGSPVKLWRADYAFQAVEVPAGRHTVRFAYEDRAFHAGAVLSCAGLLLWLGLWWKGRF